MSINQPPFPNTAHPTEGNTLPLSTLPGAVDWHGEQQTETQPTPRPPASGRRWLWMVLFGLVMALVVTAAGLLYSFEQSFHDRIYPNITIRGLPVGSMSAEAATASLRERYADFLNTPITLNYGDRSWTPSLAELGVRLEIDEAVGQALATGRSHNLMTNLREVAAVWQLGLEKPLRLTIDQQVMQQYMVSRAAEIERGPLDARILVQNGRVNTSAAAFGQQVLMNETLNDISAALQTLEPQTVAIRSRELPPLLSDNDVQAASEQVAPYLQGPLVLTAGGRNWEWSVDELAGMVRISRESQPGSADRLMVTIDQYQIRERLIEIADQTERKGQNPRVDWNGGNLRIIRPGTPGSRLDKAQAEQLVLAAMATPNRTVELPFVPVEPQVTEANLGQLGINSLLSVGQSDFTGSAPYRITNIEAGMRLLYGVLVAPGEEFSFNNTIGRIDGSTGFVEGYAIVDNRTQLEYGGGICQDSTTMFRAAFWAGLPITERWGHSFYINWYDKYAFGPYGNGPGMDAAIFMGGPDFKFLNDTGSWLLIQTFVNRGQSLAEVRIYGTNTGRKVSLVGPTITNVQEAPKTPRYATDPKLKPGTFRQSDQARGGMDINFVRVITQNGVEVGRQNFLTRFKPWPNIFEFNPVDMGPDGRPLLPLDANGIPYYGPPPTAAPAPTDPAQQPPADGSQPAPQPTPAPTG